MFRLIRIPSRWRSRLSADGTALPDEIGRRVQVDQLALRTRLSLPMVLVGVTVVLLLKVDFLDVGKGFIGAILYLQIIAAYVFFLCVCRFWVTVKEKQKYIVHFKWAISGNLFCLGIFWSILIDYLMVRSPPEKAELLYGLVIALISTAVFSSPTLWAFAFWAPVTIGGFSALFFQQGPFDLAAFMCLLGYSVVTLSSLLFLNKKMTERAVNAIRLEESNEIVKLLLRDFQESSSDWLWETNDQFVLTRASPRFSEILGQPATALEGRPLLPILASDAQEAGPESYLASAERPADALVHSMMAHAPFRDLVVPVVVKEERRWWSLTGKPIFDKSGKFVGYRGVGADVTVEQKSRERIIYLARFDSLTSLANRNEFDELLQQACARSDIAPFSLLYLDLDDFKTINDTYGHAAGDLALGVVAERLRGAIREGDIAARLGGDEFAVMVNAQDSSEAFRVANRIIDRVGRPFKLGDITLNLGVSIGIAHAPLHGNVAGALSRNADLALYRTKRDGRGGWRLYSPEEDAGFHDSRVLQLDLKQAVDGSQFFLLYQPIIDICTGRVTGLEALLRWMHPKRGLVSPAAFIPMAEQSGLIGPIGKWVIREACARAVKLPPSVRVAVNLSAVQMRDEALIDTMAQAFAETGVSPAQIEFEITEAVNLANCAQTLKILQWLQSRGSRVAIDDFGTGYSSLTLLRRFRFGKVKIDQSFIRDLAGVQPGHAPGQIPGQVIVKSVIDLAHDMGMVVTAEGVETVAQMDILRSLGCDDAQGYLFAQPLAADQLAGFVARSHLPELSATTVA